MCRVAKGALGSSGVLCSLHLTRVWTGLWDRQQKLLMGQLLVTVAEHRVSPGRDKWLC